MTDNRTATITRRTNETQIELTLNLDGSGQAQIDTGVGFFDHMLHHVAVHQVLHTPGKPGALHTGVRDGRKSRSHIRMGDLKLTLIGRELQK